MAVESPGLVALLTLADSRLPAGGHAHSGGVEPALATGLITGVDDLALLLRGRLRTAGLVAAALAAATCDRLRGGGQPFAALDAVLALLDAEADARTASPAQRAASRAQGRALLRVSRAAWGSTLLDRLAAAPHAPHHAVALGAVGAAAGCTPHGVGHVAAYLSVSGPASAAVRLRGFDPFAVQAALTALAPEIGRVADEAAAAADGPLHDLPCPTAPRLDLLAEFHLSSEVRLFAS